MFGDGSGSGLSLQIGTTTFQFNTPRDFEFALNGRTGLPASKIAALVDVSDDALLREADGIRKVERRFSEVLSRSLEDSTKIGTFLKELDLAMVSQDNDWRIIISALNTLDPDHEEFKRVALVKYMQYLSSRQDVVKSIYSHRQQHKQTPEVEVSGAQLKETLIFDLTSIASPEQPEHQLGRLPKGETVEIPLGSKQSVSVRLGRHNFSLVADGTFCFQDENGEDFPLQPGKNIVGRDASSDIVVDASYRDVSRKHLIIETEGTGLAKLTDISSLGTFVPSEYLDRTGL